MRRAQERDERRAGKIARDQIDEEIERSGRRFRGERQRVRDLERNSGSAERVLRQIEVRQRTAEYDADALERCGTERPLNRLLCDGDQLLFPVSTREPLAIV